MVPSSSGLGRGPLKAATRVQIPLGSPLKKSAQTALFLMVMRRLVTQAGKRKLSEIGVTSQVPEAKLGLR